MSHMTGSGRVQKQSGKAFGSTLLRRIWQYGGRGVILWLIGLCVFVVACVIIHAHRNPFAIDIATTQTIQGLHLWPWLNAILVFPSVFNNPIPSMIMLGCWVVWMLIMGGISHLRGKSSLPWVQTAVALILVVLLSTGLQGATEELVARPRPNPQTDHIHVYTPLVPFPTFPSGHTDHDVVFYGFLLYLSLTKPVRAWRYRWLLLPLQCFAVFDILTIGYSRILEGDHWLTDVLGGYLEGALHLFMFIVLYRWLTDVLAQKRLRRKQA